MARALLACALGAGSLASVPAARAGTGGLVVVSRAQYVPGDNNNHVPAVIPQGYDLEFANLDPTSFGGHTLSETTCPIGGPPPADCVFDSGVVNPESSVILPTSSLPPGTYGFYCKVHLGMFGTLIVE